MTLRLAHLSDLHFGGEAIDAVEAAPEALAAFKPSLTLITGDVTLSGRNSEFRSAAAWLARLPGPRLVTPGNHDTPYWDLLQRLTAPFDRYVRHIGPVEASTFDGPGLVARTLNSARGVQARWNWSRGALAMDRLRRIDWRSPSPAPLRLFACHHPLLHLAGAPVEGGGANARDVLAHLAATGVELILSGHEHMPFVRRLPGGPTVGWAVGAGTLSRRLRGSPPGFTTVLVEPAAFEITALAWTGERFEPWRTWRASRG